MPAAAAAGAGAARARAGAQRLLLAARLCPQQVRLGSVLAAACMWGTAGLQQRRAGRPKQSSASISMRAVPMRLDGGSAGPVPAHWNRRHAPTAQDSITHGCSTHSLLTDLDRGTPRARLQLRPADVNKTMSAIAVAGCGGRT
jgi:hypothetical protein